MIDLGDANTAVEDAVRTALIPQLWCFGFSWLKFDSNVRRVEKICPCIDDAKAAFSNLPIDFVVISDYIWAVWLACACLELPQLSM